MFRTETPSFPNVYFGRFPSIPLLMIHLRDKLGVVTSKLFFSKLENYRFWYLANNQSQSLIVKKVFEICGLPKPFTKVGLPYIGHWPVGLQGTFQPMKVYTNVSFSTLAKCVWLLERVPFCK